MEYKYSISESAYGSGMECNGYGSDLDDVFDTVPGLIERYHKNTITTVEFYSEMKRLLHLYILPCIRLTRDNIGAVQKCLVLQQSHLKRIDAEILTRTETRAKIQQYKREERQQFISELTTVGPPSKYIRAFAEILLTDLTSDIEETSVKLDSAQMYVDKIKRTLRGMKDTNDWMDATLSSLALSRTERDSAVQERVRCLEAKEAIKEIIRLLDDESSSTLSRIKSRLRRDSDDVPVHRKYITLAEEEAEVRAEILALTSQKLLAISVKEAIRSCLNDLVKGRETCGVDWSATGSQNAATDVLFSGSVSRSWQTLKQQVDSILSTKTHPIAKRHLRMCQRVHERVKSATYEKGLFDMGTPILISVPKNLDCSGSVSASTSLSHSNLKSRRTNSLDSSTPLHNGSWFLSSRAASNYDVSDGMQIPPNQLKSRSLLSKTPSSTSLHRPKTWKKLQTVSEATFQSYVKESEGACRMPCVPFYVKPQSIGGLDACLCRIHDISPYLDPSSRELDSESAARDTLPNSSHISPDKPDQSRKHPRDKDDISVSPVVKSQSLMDRHFSTDSPDDDAIVIFNADKNYLKDAIGRLSKNIATHFQTVCNEFQMDLGKTQTHNYRKIWLVYEPYFYRTNMGLLEQIYSEHYSDVIGGKFKSLESLTVPELALDNAILTHMLQDLKPEVGSTGVSGAVKIPERSTKCLSIGTSTSFSGRDSGTVLGYDQLSVNGGARGRRATTPSESCDYGDAIMDGVDYETSVSFPVSVGRGPKKIVIPGHADVKEQNIKDQGCSDADNSISHLQRHLSDPTCPRLSTVRVSVNVQGPVSGIIVYDRTLCPMSEPAHHESDKRESSNNLGVEKPVSVLNGKLPKTLQLKPRYKVKFAAALECLAGVINAKTPYVKLQHLYRCLGLVNRQISDFNIELCNGRAEGLILINCLLS